LDDFQQDRQLTKNYLVYGDQFQHESSSHFSVGYGTSIVTMITNKQFNHDNVHAQASPSMAMQSTIDCDDYHDQPSDVQSQWR
jgi:hypothetical protein